MSNVGIAPPDFTSEIGKLRSLLGDVAYIDLVPPETGFGDYTNFSDQQLQTYIDLSPVDNLAYAAGYAYSGLAAQFAADALKLTTNDEAIDLTGRAEAMRKLSEQWFARGDAIVAAQTAAYHDIIQPEYQRDNEWIPELATPIIEFEWWK